MKPIYYFVLGTSVLMASCAGPKFAGESKKELTTSIKGEKLIVETLKVQGVEMAETPNDEGTDMIKVPFKWYAGVGKADNKQTAIEMAQREAYATISRILSNAVIDGSEKGELVNNGRVQQALSSHWSQVSTSLQKGCEPFGEVTIEYSPTEKMYDVTAKVAIRGDRFKQLLDAAGEYRPNNLSGDDLAQFIKVNKSIMEAARGN